MSSSTSASVHSHANTMHSIGNQIGYKIRNITHYGQPSIDIHLNGHREGPSRIITSYSTMDTVQGTVSITAQHDTRFEDIDIALTGTSQTYVERLTATPSMTGRTEATHRFLVLRQPIQASDFPTPRLFEAGRTYQFPFTFTIPAQLLPKSCPHKVTSNQVRDAHLQLPPSLGDPDLAGFGSTLLDDLAPEMSKIVYAVKVRIAHQRPSEGGISILAEKSRRIRVKPAFEEQPPVEVSGSEEYRSRQEKTIRKGMFKGKLGTMVAQAVQPKALVIPGARTTDNKPITTMAKVFLRFDPSEKDAEPPKLKSLSTKIKATTYYASSPRHSFPTRSSLGYDLSQGLYAENISLSTLCIASAPWEKHTSEPSSLSDNSPFRRDSGISDCSTTSATASMTERSLALGIPPASSTYKQGTFYTAQILVPITLPTNKNFIPTFHSCLVSRTYTLSLQFAPHSGPSMHLKIPVQICANGSASGIENARARSVEESALRHVDEVFVPRSIAPPVFGDEADAAGPRRAGSSAGDDARDELPPEYAAYAPPVTRYRISVAA